MKQRVYEVLGTSIIYSPTSLPCLSKKKFKFIINSSRKPNFIDEQSDPYNKVTGFLSVSPLQGSFSLILGRFMNILGEGATTLPREIAPR